MLSEAMRQGGKQARGELGGRGNLAVPEPRRANAHARARDYCY
jgi:hypothetical protein